jgi:hypothetical protein
MRKFQATLEKPYGAGHGFSKVNPEEKVMRLSECEELCEGNEVQWATNGTTQ